MRQKLTSSPPVIMLDTLWGTLLVDTGEKERDKKGRLHRVKRGVRLPLLVAMSIDPLTGTTSLVAWVQGKATNLEDWTRLLEGRNEDLRAKWRQVKVFRSAEGQLAALLLVCRRQERLDKTDCSAWVTHLMAALLAPDQSAAKSPLHDTVYS